MTEANKTFIESMGTEYLSVSINNDNISLKKIIRIKNQADWFVFHGHGGISGGISTRLLKSLYDRYSWSPDSLNIINKNVDFAIFSCCFAVGISYKEATPKREIHPNSSAITWRNKLGNNTVLLGYSTSIPGTYLTKSLFNFIESLKSWPIYPYNEFYKKQIINFWLSINKDLYFSETNSMHEDLPDVSRDEIIEAYNSILGVTAVYKNQYFFLKKRRGDDFDNANSSYLSDFITAELDIKDFIVDK